MSLVCHVLSTKVPFVFQSSNIFDFIQAVNKILLVVLFTHTRDQLHIMSNVTRQVINGIKTYIWNAISVFTYTSSFESYAYILRTLIS